MNHGEGVIKFKCHWSKVDIPDLPVLDELINYRNRLFNMKFIGCGQNGVGYGNISIRYRGNYFFISGSATGSVVNFQREHISLVTGFDIQKNLVVCSGHAKASSESLTHAIFYQIDPDINSVIHIHHKNLWAKYLYHYPTTDPSVKYGTPEMALQIKHHLQKNDNVIIMGGHEDGILTFGISCESAYHRILDLINEKC